jgi:hypothetical protein
MTDTPGPAELLREAAKLMRERAALVPPPPWCSSGHDIWTADGIDEIASADLTVRAQYIASWHPAVTLAVAGWLEQLAAEAEAFLHPDGSCDRCDLWFGNQDDTEADAVCTCWDAALAVATAYLGETR